jgi:hypothetical protein
MVSAYQLVRLINVAEGISMASQAVQLPEVDGISMLGFRTEKCRGKYLNGG